MSRAYDDNQTLQQKIIKGANVLADNVASTLGPRGRNVLLQEKGKQPFITKDGVTVAHFVELDDPFENAGAQILRQAAIETRRVTEPPQLRYWREPSSENHKDSSLLGFPLSSYNVV